MDRSERLEFWDGGNFFRREVPGQFKRGRDGDRLPVCEISKLTGKIININFDWSRDTIWRYLRRYGTVLCLSFKWEPLNAKGQTRYSGSGWVHFKYPEELERCKQEMVCRYEDLEGKPRKMVVIDSDREFRIKDMLSQEWCVYGPRVDILGREWMYDRGGQDYTWRQCPMQWKYSDVMACLKQQRADMEYKFGYYSVR
jgi:hypothetical protein